MEKGEIAIYQTSDGQTKLEVKLDNESVWLTQRQIADLFGTEVPGISKHIANIYHSKELDPASTVSKMEIVRKEGNREIRRQIEHYNLDMIISIGYRVNSVRGTQFRIWAGQILKDYFIRGYVLNEKRLLEERRQHEELKQAVRLMGKVLENQPLDSDQATGLMKVVTDYSYALDILDRYDHQALEINGTTAAEHFRISYDAAIDAIQGLKDKFGGSSLFGNEKDESFRGSLSAIYQTFDGKDLYPSVEEKAANLLYFVVKNHSFSDGNKRIAAFLLVWFMEKNGILYKTDGSRRLVDNALVAVTLMIAESNPSDKDSMVKIVVNLINAKN
ncbi:MAG: cytochrome C biogenesis protein CycH [Citrobacter freundii]|nr:MAG: cytochrome C biogenesis protein CycH [Citrobacter freundii]